MENLLFEFFHLPVQCVIDTSGEPWEVRYLSTKEHRLANKDGMIISDGGTLSFKGQ